MEQIAIRNLTFAYGAESDFSLRNVSMDVYSGEILLICGNSGCGKTTLLHHLKKEFMPQGVRNQDYSILLKGHSLEEWDDRQLARTVGFVAQNVESTMAMDTVWHELAFGLENLGYEQGLMERKLAEITTFFGLESIYYEKICNLSGGQKQLVNLAAVMVMDPEILILDEPTSQLDPVSASDFLRMIAKINQEFGTTIVMTEHGLEEVYAMCHRVCVMDAGQIKWMGSREEVAQKMYAKQYPLREALPSATGLCFALQGTSNSIPFSVNDGRKWLQDFITRKEIDYICHNHRCNDATEKAEKILTTKKRNKEYAIELRDVWFRYEKEGRDILHGCNLKVEPGKVTAILGGNGTGKSTLLHLIAGIYKPYSGRLRVHTNGTVDEKTSEESIALLPQNPQVMFGEKTVAQELGDSVLEEELFDFSSLYNQHPFDLSGGEMQKLAFAKIYIQDKEIWLLDEPGKAMDYVAKQQLGRLLRTMATGGKTILMVSHDVEFCARFADVCGMFFQGTVGTMQDTKTFFSKNTFYTTAVARICKGTLEHMVTIEDVLQVFGGKNPERKSKPLQPKQPEPKLQDLVKKDSKQPEPKLRDLKLTDFKDKDRKEKNTSKRLTHNAVKRLKTGWWIKFLIIFLVMPFTIYIGHEVLQQRKYYFISLLLVLESIAAFYLGFEKRKPQPRDVMVIAVLCGITVVGRLAFYMVPNVKPTAALVIVAGLGLGAQAGFLIGSLSMLVSDIFFGQGPWTPWQMFALGMVGFVGGLLFHESDPRKRSTRLGICLYGFMAIVLLYGGIMNPASVLMYQEQVTRDMIIAAYVAGLPYDLMHGAATFGFLWFGCRPLWEQLQRVTKKYHFML